MNESAEEIAAVRAAFPRRKAIWRYMTASGWPVRDPYSRTMYMPPMPNWRG